jgi:phosphatidate cytidylyltransferase
MRRVLTALVILPPALAAIFFLSGWGFLLFALAVVEMAAVEYAMLTSRLAGRGAAWAIPVLVPVVVLLLLPDVTSVLTVGQSDRLLLLGFVVGAGAGIVALFSRQPLEETVAATGVLSFGVLYFSVPIAALVRLHAVDVWLVILAVVVVWAGDTAAFYIGTKWGRHALAPVVSPNKTWEGACASLAAGVVAAAIWSTFRLGRIDAGILLVAAGTSVAAQTGDLVESTLKRRLGVKDSSGLLPGHGGMLDRLDSLLFALPALALGLLIIGWRIP